MTTLSSELFVYYGHTANDGTGDQLRDAFIKTQTNINSLFDYLNNNPYFANISANILTANLVVGTSSSTNALNSATTSIVVSSAIAPVAGQVLTATSGTAANWQTIQTGTSSSTDALNSLTTSIAVSGATAPTAGQVLTATSNSSANWQSISVGTSNVILQNASSLSISDTGSNGTLALAVDGTNYLTQTATSFTLGGQTPGPFSLSEVSGAPFILSGLSTGAVGGIVVSPTSPFALISDYLNSHTNLYSINPSTGSMTLVTTAVTGAAMDAFSFYTNDGKYVYLTDSSYDGTGSASLYQYSQNASTGALTQIGTATLPATPYYLYDIKISPDGLFMYAMSTGGLYRYPRTPSTGVIGNSGTLLESTLTGPIGVSQYGLYIINSNTNITVYSRDPVTGGISSPTNVAVAYGSRSNQMGFSTLVTPDDKFFYYSTTGQSYIVGFNINQSTGAITPIAGSPFATSASISGTTIALSPDGTKMYTGPYASPYVVTGLIRDTVSGTLTAAASHTTTGYSRNGLGISYNNSFVITPMYTGSTVDVLRTSTVLPVPLINATYGATGGGLLNIGGTTNISGSLTATTVSGAGTGLTGTAASLTSGASNALKSATTTISVSGATAPTAGQVLTATSSTAADWQTVSATISGNVSVPGLPFIDSSNGGLYELPSGGLGLSNSGTQCLAISGTGLTLGKILSSNIALSVATRVGVSTSSSAISLSPNGLWLAESNYTYGISMYSVNSNTGALAHIMDVTIPFSAPLDVVFSPDGRYVYLSNDNNSILYCYSVNQTTGAITQTSTLGISYNVRIVRISPDGAFMYMTLNGGGIAVYSRNITTGVVSSTLVQQLNTVTASNNQGCLVITQTGVFVLNGSSIVSMTRDPTTGIIAVATASLSVSNTATWLTASPSGNFLYASVAPLNLIDVVSVATNQTISLSGISVTLASASSCIVSPDGNYLYAEGGSVIEAYSINATSGALTSIASGAITAGTFRGITITPSGNRVVLLDSTANAVSVVNTQATPTVPLLQGYYDLSGGSNGILLLNGSQVLTVAGTSAATNALNSATTTISVSGATAPTAGQVLTATSSTAADWQSRIYDISGGTTGSPTGNAIVLTFPSVRSFSLSANIVGSYSVSGTAATATTTFSLTKNGTSFGSMTFASSANVATFLTSATSFVAGDIFKVVAPSTVDATLADIGFTIVGTV